MRHFYYKALSAERKVLEGDTFVEEKSDLDKFFLERSLMPLNIREEKESPFKVLRQSFEIWWNRKLFETELITFTRQFSAGYGAGLPVAKIFEILAAQTTHIHFHSALIQISKRIQSGRGLVEAVSEFPKFFDATYRAMLSSGELTGNLDTVLDYVANILEKRKAHQERIKSTLLYPKIVVFFMVICVIIVLAFVIPQFKKIFDKFETALPLPTLILMRASEYFMAYWWLGFFLVPLWILFVEYLKKRPDFMMWLHATLLDIPMMGNIFKKVELTHFCTTFALLLRAGIKVTDATTTAVNALSNVFLREELRKIIPAIEQGGTLTQALTSIKGVPALMTSMIAVGEQSGTLDKLLDRVAKLYEDEAEALMKKLPTFLEPIILSILFVLVLFLALAVYLPMWKMASVIKK